MTSIDSQAAIQRHLREDGLDELAEFLNGPVKLTELKILDFLEAMEKDWVVVLKNDDAEIHFAYATDDETIIQARDSNRDGNFTPAMKAWPPEVEDYIFSGQYTVSFAYPERSGFEVAEA